MASRRPPAEDGSRADSQGDGADRPAGERPLPPGPDGLPVLGSLVPLVRDPFAFFETLDDYGGVVRYAVAGRTFVALLDPEHVERVLVAEPDRFERYVGADLGLDFASEGVLFAGGEQWRRQRHLMQPAFTMDRIESYGDTMAEYAARAFDGWADGETVDLTDAFSTLTLRILTRALFDVDPSGDDAALARATRVINERAGPGRNATALLPDWLPTPANRRYDRAMRAYHERVDHLIERRRARSEGEDADDLLSILLHAEGPDGYALSDDEIRDNLVTFLFAGHETTSLALTYTTMLLAEHDDVLADLRAEVDAVLDGDRPGVECVPRLEFTEQVIREAMRLYPPAFVMFRRATGDATLGGYRIPEGTFLTLPQFRLHTDGRFWDDPDEFRPARWAADADRPEYAYFPFGGGPRHCVGMRFAMLELRLIVASLVARFDLELVSDPDPALSTGVTLQPADPVRVRVRRRS